MLGRMNDMIIFTMTYEISLKSQRQHDVLWVVCGAQSGGALHERKRKKEKKKNDYL
jgi:hypothetical protein